MWKLPKNTINENSSVSWGLSERSKWSYIIYSLWEAIFNVYETIWITTLTLMD